MTQLYVIIDPAFCRGRDPLWVAEAALSGGCRALQLRSKLGDDREKLALGRQLRELARRAAAPFWINDRADLAMLCSADGLHLGQRDLPLAEARRLVGSAMQLGLSTHSLAELGEGLAQQPDLLGFGPIFATQSKSNPDPVVGPAGLAQALAHSHRPLVAIGGIQPDNVAQVAALRPAYAAVIGAVCGADDPERAARELAAKLA